MFFVGLPGICALILEQAESGGTKIKEFVNHKHGQTTTLHAAVTSRSLEVLELLLTKGGMDRLITDDNGRTALHLAAAGGYIDVIKVLCRQKGIPTKEYLDRLDLQERT